MHPVGRSAVVQAYGELVNKGRVWGIMQRKLILVLQRKPVLTCTVFNIDLNQCYYYYAASLKTISISLDSPSAVIASCRSHLTEMGRFG
jgi:hypothetical protein